jgi:hypothetical protein
MGEEGAGAALPAWRRSRWRRGAIAVAAALATVAITGALWRFRFETNDDLTFAFAMTGNALLPPQGDFYLFFRGGLGELLSVLHGWFGPSTYGAFLLGLLTVAIARLFARALAAPARGTADLAATFAVATWVVAVTFSPLSFSRVALLAAFIGFDGFQSSARGPYRGARGGARIDLALALVGYAVRPQAGLLALALALALRAAESVRRRRLARHVLAAAAIVAAFWIYDRIATSAVEEEYLRRYWHATNLLDRRTPLRWPQDPVDVARLNLARRWLFFDDQAYNSEFLARHVSAAPFDLERKLAEAPRGFALMLDRLVRYGGLWLPALLLGLTVERLAAGERMRAAEPLAKALLVLTALFAVAAAVGMKPRVREPAIAALCLHLLAERLWSAPPPGRPWLSYAAVLAAVSAIVLAGIRLAPERRAFDAQVRRVHAQVDAMERLGDRTVLATLGSPFEAMLVWNRPLAVRLPSPALRLVPLQGWITQSEGYRAMLDRAGGGRGFAGFARAIERDPGGYAVIGNRDAVERTLGWAALAYGPRLRVEARRQGPLPYYAFVGR